jgi:hypothetical protein
MFSFKKQVGRKDGGAYKAFSNTMGFAVVFLFFSLPSGNDEEVRQDGSGNEKGGNP